MLRSKVIHKTIFRGTSHNKNFKKFVCQFVPKRYFRILKIVDDVKQLNITNI